MYRESDMQRLERELKHLKLKDQITRLWSEFRLEHERRILSENKRADLIDAIKDVVLFRQDKDIDYLSEVYTKQKGDV